MKKRTKCRLWALQAAYSSITGCKKMEPALEEFYTYRGIGSENREFTTKLVRQFSEHLEEVDSLLAAHLKNWSPERLALMDRIVIQLAVTEFLYLEDVPPKVTINEYVGLAHMFGTEDSPRFVNGVLDAVNKTLGRNPESLP
ncbi:MAG: transcription antitermination factor NusB [Gemmatimonadota bacterium]|nr:transcription antitermination factor NusB [Gemmatimonadota bacterium]